jgi:hypothetical protein
MKTKYSIIILFSLIMLQCVPFPDRYERIEPNKIRTNGFVYEPYPEGAPGDTIRAYMHFAGEKVDSVNLQMSYSHVITIYGQDTVMDVFDLPVISESNRLPDSLAFSFVVPESTFFKTKALPQEGLQLIKQFLPPSMQSLTQQDFAALLMDLGNLNYNNTDSITRFMQRQSALLPPGTDQNSSLNTFLAVVGKLDSTFSIPAVLYAEAYADNGRKLKIKGDFVIRYNRRLQNSPFAALFPVNEPPKVRWIGLYKVKGSNITSFNPADTSFTGDFSINYLYNKMFPDSVHDTVLIDNGYTYFLAADSGMVRYTLHAGTRVADSIKGADTVWRILEKDTTIADTSRYRRHVVDAAGKNTVEMETFYYDWQYQDLDMGKVTMPLDSLMVISPAGDPVVSMLPSLDTNFTHARIWTTVYDYLLNERNRPTAFTFRQADIYFKYTDRYKMAVKR